MCLENVHKDEIVLEIHILYRITQKPAWIHNLKGCTQRSGGLHNLFYVQKDLLGYIILRGCTQSSPGIHTNLRGSTPQRSAEIHNQTKCAHRPVGDTEL